MQLPPSCSQEQQWKKAGTWLGACLPVQPPCAALRTGIELTLEEPSCITGTGSTCQVVHNACNLEMAAWDQPVMEPVEVFDSYLAYQIGI